MAGCVLADTLSGATPLGAAPVGDELHEASFYEPLAGGKARDIENNVVKGACKACGKTIPGVWE